MTSSPPDGPTDRPATAFARVLLCDDSATVRAVLASLLERFYEVLPVSTAEEALVASPDFLPDVILSDVVLPGMSGADFCRAAKASPALAGIPFVLFTNLADDDACTAGFDAGADDYVRKPVREGELLARIASLVRLRRTVVALEERTAALEALNRALAATQAELVHAERLAAVGSLAAGLAHEVSNPLAVIKASVSSLDRALGDIQAAGLGLAAAGPGDVSAVDELARALEEARDVAESLADGSRRLERLACDLRIAGWKPPPTRARALAPAWSLAGGE